MYVWCDRAKCEGSWQTEHTLKSVAVQRSWGVELDGVGHFRPLLCVLLLAGCQVVVSGRFEREREGAGDSKTNDIHTLTLALKHTDTH